MLIDPKEAGFPCLFASATFSAVFCSLSFALIPAFTINCLTASSDLTKSTGGGASLRFDVGGGAVLPLPLVEEEEEGVTRPEAEAS